MKSSISVYCDDISVEHGFSDAPINSSDIADGKYCAVYVISDGVLVKSRDKIQKLQSGTVIFFAHNADLLIFSENACAYEKYIVTFSHSAIISDADKLLEALLSQRRNGYATYQIGRYNSSVDAIFDRFFDSASFSESERRVYLMALLSELLILISATDDKPSLKTKALLADRVIKYINLNIQGELTLEQIAGRFFVSKFYLCRAFKQATGCSIHNYVIECRLKYADELISAGETISMAAYKSGFSDYSTFYRAYIKKFGEPPSQKLR